MLSSGLPWRALCLLLTPAIVDGVLHILQVGLRNSSDKEDLDVVLDRGELRVVNSGFRR